MVCEGSEAALPTIDSVTVPVAAMLFAVRVSVALEPVAVAGVKVAVKPFDIPIAVKPTFPAKPPVRVIVIGFVVVDPWARGTVGTLAAMVKPPGTTLTVSEKERVTLATPLPLALTARGYVPALTVMPTFMLTVLVVVLPLTWGAAADAVTPLGAPLTAIAAAPVNPLEPVTVTPKVTDSPCMTVAPEEVRAMAICGGGPVPEPSLPPPQPANSVQAIPMANMRPRGGR